MTRRDREGGDVIANVRFQIDVSAFARLRESMNVLLLGMQFRHFEIVRTMMLSAALTSVRFQNESASPRLSEWMNVSLLGMQLRHFEIVR